jgi:2,5-diamino-6-(ribosylamino)-4(3H)-pyrimidinone 5'-phosphate reductase
LTGKVLRLYPLPAREIAAGEIYQDLDLPPPERRDSSRPYVIINMVSSLDGKATANGKAFRIGSEVDRTTMRNLRAKSDAVMIGAATLRAEMLSLSLDEAEGSSQPLGVIVTSTGEVPLDRNLIQDEHQKVLVLVPEGLPEARVGRLHPHADVLRAPTTPDGTIDLERALRALRYEHAVELLLVEGGPSLNHALISSNLADELFLTLAPKLLGGATDKTLTILGGPALVTGDMKLLSAYLASDELFLRYALGGS